MNVYTEKYPATVPKEYNTYCRICANKDSDNMMPIFNNKGDFWSIAEKISHCLHIVVHPSDVLPLSLCTSCLRKLNTCHDLIEMAENAEKQLKAIFECNELFQDDGNGDFWEQEQENLMNLKQEPFIFIKEEVNSDDTLESNDDKVSSKMNNAFHMKNSRNDTNDYHLTSSACREVEVKCEGKAKTPAIDQYGKNTFMPQLTIDGPATCDLCNAFFVDMDEFDLHIENEHKQKNLWLCGLCHSTFKASSELISHKALVHQEEAVSCDKCKNMLVKDEDSDLNNKDSDADDDDFVGEDDTEFEFNTENEDTFVEEYEEGFQVQTHFMSSNENKEENSEYVCNTCKRSFKSQTDLDEHQLVHVPRQATCNPCGLVCSSLFDLSIHKREHLQFARERLYNCEICCKSFITYNSLSVHQHHCVGKEEFTCNICDAMFANKVGLQLHLKTHEQRKRVYECDCGEKCDTYASFQAHKRTHSDTPARKCVTCHKEFNNSKRYRRHRYIHDPAFWDRFKCQICKRPFRDAQALRNHMQLHTGLKPHMCDLCGRTYNRYANMLKHRRLHKPQNLWEHVCGQCDTKFERAKDLTAHMEHVHPPLEPVDENPDGPKKSALRWICKFCGKGISSKLSLQDHERIHTGAKPYICEWCGREFRSRPNLIQHHLTHTGDRRHACPICGKRFSRKSFITQHMRVHTGEKPFVCDICGKRFTQAGDMRRHRGRHTAV